MILVLPLFSMATEVFRFYTPEILVDFVDCFSDLFVFIVDIFVDAAGREENLPLCDSIMNDAVFVVDTVLPTTGERLNKRTEQNIVNLVDLYSK